jgi:uroporphyrinogen-III synthase
MRALITRPRAEAERLAALLAPLGIAAVVEPLIAVSERAVEAPDLGGVQAVLCTSANGVRALARASAERSVALFAVGDATAARARAEGFRHVESAGGDVEDLAYLVSRRLKPQGGRLLHVAGSEVAGELAKSLADGGFAVERMVLYEAQAAEAISPGTAVLFAAHRGGLCPACRGGRCGGRAARDHRRVDQRGGRRDAGGFAVSRAADRRGAEPSSPG